MKRQVLHSRMYILLLTVIILVLGLLLVEDFAFAGTTEMRLEKTYKGSIGKAGEIDYFTFCSKNGGAYYLYVENLTVNSKYSSLNDYMSSESYSAYAAPMELSYDEKIKDEARNDKSINGKIKNTFTVVGTNKNNKVIPIGMRQYPCNTTAIVLGKGNKIVYPLLLEEGTTKFKINGNGKIGKYKISIIKQPTCPKIQTSVYSDKVKVSWSKKSKATGYYIYVFYPGYGEPEKIGTKKTNEKREFVYKTNMGHSIDFEVVPYRKWHGTKIIAESSKIMAL